MKKRVIIDTDPGVDDALALMLALRSPEIRVEAITTVGGNVSLDQTTKNASLILDLLSPMAKPILARGLALPQKSGLLRSRSVHGSDGLGGLDRFTLPDGGPRYPYPHLPRDMPDATEVLLDLLKHNPDELTLIMLGPLTNLAAALQADRRRIKDLREVIIMGGAIKVPGNITPAAEFNIFADPHAAHQVFQSGLPITLVPLDVTRKTYIEAMDIVTISQAMDDRLGGFFRDVTSRAIEYMNEVWGTGVLHLHDPLAVAVAINPTMVKSTPLCVDVETHRGITRGMTLADLRAIQDNLKQPPNLHVALEVSPDTFLSVFKERLCAESQ